MSAQASLDLWTLAGICLLGAMTPGPSVVVILGVATRSGARAAVLASWTHALGVALWAFLTLYGWRLIVTHAPWAAQTISLLGAGYLIYLAYQMWSEASVLNPHIERTETSGDQQIKIQTPSKFSLTHNNTNFTPSRSRNTSISTPRTITKNRTSTEG